jgi:hypothetical protein
MHYAHRFVDWVRRFLLTEKEAGRLLAAKLLSA